MNTRYSDGWIVQFYDKYNYISQHKFFNIANSQSQSMKKKAVTARFIHRAQVPQQMLLHNTECYSER